ncbi:MAG: Rrf2 family transcriptional regulator [candidate division WOR-3 bacterium]
MKLSTKGRYAARAMLDLALNHNKGPVSAKEIAKRQKISERYLENIFSVLSKAGLVNSTRGKSGGFSLSGNPEDIDLGEIIMAVEGSLAPVDCVENSSHCDRVSICVTYEIWRKLEKAMMDILSSTTLKDMIDIYNTKNPTPESIMYYI